MGLSRATLLAASTAVAVFGPTTLAALAVTASKADPGDIAWVNGAIPLELAAVNAYTRAIGSGLLEPALVAVAISIRTDHQAHAQALAVAVKAAGVPPATKPAPIAIPTLRTQLDILKFAESLERQAATLYLNAVAAVNDHALARALASIMGVETTHVAALAAVLGEGKPYGAFVS